MGYWATLKAAIAYKRKNPKAGKAQIDALVKARHIKTECKKPLELKT